MTREQGGSRRVAAHVLIVDDAPGVKDVLGIKLERDGYVVALADSAAEATEAIEAHEFDLILLDVRLPDGNGLELLKQMRQRRSLLDTPIIMISGLDQTEDVVAALREGANDYISKPFDLAVVVARIRTQVTLKRLKEVHDHFLRIASHDLKKPLLVMLDVARQLREEYPPGTPVSDDLHVALDFLIDSGKFMQEIIGDLLDLGALRDQQMRVIKRPTDFGAVVRLAVARNTPYAKSKGGELRMDFARDLPNIQADDARVMQVLENLIGNAIKYSQPGSTTTVRSTRDGDWIVCDVCDTGPGIPEKEKDLLFKEYSRLSNTPTGGETSTGLGLSICRELVLLHGGDIGARNNPDRGATFWFRLPIS
ncbi:MAG TPA: response regulator [Burkholderiales bacterium]|nr:response regulator [Burkholderiales bacterium]